MVELIDAIILDKSAPKEGVSLSFDIGINELSNDKRYLFNFLLLKNQVLDSGSFVVNNHSIVPLKNEEDSLFVLAINSQNISISVCFLVNANNKYAEVKSVQEELIKLRDLPLDTYSNRVDKIRCIFNILKNHHAAYVLLDKSNDINKTNLQYINPVINEYTFDLTIIAIDNGNQNNTSKFDELDSFPDVQKKSNDMDNLDIESETKKKSTFVQEKKVDKVSRTQKRNTFDLPPAFDVVNIGGDDFGFYHEEPAPKKKSIFAKKEKPQKTKEESITIGDMNEPKAKESHKIDFHYIKKLMKKEWSSFLFILYGVLSTVFFFFVVPFQFATKNGTLSVVFLIGGILCFLVTILIISSLFDFLDKEKVSQKRFRYSIAFSEIFIVIGFLLALLVLFILKKNNVLIKADIYAGKHLIVGIIFFVITLIIPFISKYLRHFINKIKSIFKKNGKE